MYGAYVPMPDPNAQRDAFRSQWSAYMASPEYEREQFERGLQSQEQQRRQYDSETARQSQSQKYGVLGGLVKRMGSSPMGGYGGQSFTSRKPMGY